MSLSAIKALIVHMGSLKEGRKSLILVSEGFTYMVPPQMRNADAQDARARAIPTPATRTPARTTSTRIARRGRRASTWTRDLREIYDTANRNNVAIYAVDPRGLPGFEFDINEGVGLQTDAKYLNSTMDTLRTLAENTDGRAIVNRNDIAAGMKQITRDSSAYYLIGYNSSQAPADGKFHEIKVRVKRPGRAGPRAQGLLGAQPRPKPRGRCRRRRPRRPSPWRTRLQRGRHASVARERGAHLGRHVARRERQDARDVRLGAAAEVAGRLVSSRSEPAARVSLMAVGTDGSPSFRGKIRSAARRAAAVRRQVNVEPRRRRVSFDVNPGRFSSASRWKAPSSQVLDSETREITRARPDVAQALLGTPAVLRARTSREFSS